jgi:hypothetical protein
VRANAQADTPDEVRDILTAMVLAECVYKARAARRGACKCNATRHSRFASPPAQRPASEVVQKAAEFKARCAAPQRQQRLRCAAAAAALALRSRCVLALLLAHALRLSFPCAARRSFRRAWLSRATASSA